MPVPVAAKVGIVAASVAVAAAIAIYEIPEVRRAAEDLRRRIAVALYALGENVDPNREPREPRFNRPEDAEGFYQTHDVDADEETRRRQREELMYWNLRREEQQRDHEQVQQRPRGSTFDDFLSPDRTSDNGTFVYNTGANAWDAEPSNVLRRRANAEGVRGLDAAAMLANPFSDEHGIELEDRAELPPPAPARRAGTMSSDIYNATPMVLSPVAAPAPAASEVLFDFESHNNNHPSEPPNQRPATPTTTAASTTTRSSATLDRELAEDEYMTAGQDDDAYASIQAWAHHTSSSNNTAGFYSPLPHTPQAPLSEPEIISEAGGQHTPTDSASVAGSGVDVAHDDAVSHDDDFDAMSESDDGAGIHTPGSWSKVGSVVSEGESLARA
ncbi:hypothetical protein C8A01DRAFT_44202 [Parachaetomium inaequale]|uniref:Uncharacterized protein n=1 Tax=Parachaetomium inaequale TaxID=2588326 RepID=A0AAN6SUB6_9PEZI|nr:hypothetical protein C8A01DRAFT_44202 [Parachaetomium inaequale]